MMNSLASDVIVDGEILGDMLIEAGMAIRYDGRKKTHKWWAVSGSNRGPTD